MPRREPEILAKRINQAIITNVNLENTKILEKVHAEKIAQHYLALIK